MAIIIIIVIIVFTQCSHNRADDKIIEKFSS